MAVQRPAAMAAYWGESYFPALDGVRAVCILLVMFNHVHEPMPLWVQGRIGVDIFFVLSGFLITTLLLRERERHGNVSLKGFYTRRFFRIVPVYALVVVIYLGDRAGDARCGAMAGVQGRASLPGDVYAGVPAGCDGRDAGTCVESGD